MLRLIGPSPRVAGSAGPFDACSTKACYQLGEDLAENHFAANDGETGGPKECGSADNSDAAKGLVVDAVVAVVAAVSIYAVALF